MRTVSRCSPNSRAASRMLIPSTITALRTRRYTSTLYIRRTTRRLDFKPMDGGGRYNLQPPILPATTRPRGPLYRRRLHQGRTHVGYAHKKPPAFNPEVPDATIGLPWRENAHLGKALEVCLHLSGFGLTSFARGRPATIVLHQEVGCGQARADARLCFSKFGSHPHCGVRCWRASGIRRTSCSDPGRGRRRDLGGHPCGRVVRHSEGNVSRTRPVWPGPPGDSASTAEGRKRLTSPLHAGSPPYVCCRSGRAAGGLL